MTAKNILKDIIENYEPRKEWQSDIANRYQTSSSIISELLQECGFRRGKLSNGKAVDIEEIWQNPEVQRLCKKIQIDNANK